MKTIQKRVILIHIMQLTQIESYINTILRHISSVILICKPITYASR